jgi:hypothetical protein
MERSTCSAPTSFVRLPKPIPAATETTAPRIAPTDPIRRRIWMRDNCPSFISPVSSCSDRCTRPLRALKPMCSWLSPSPVEVMARTFRARLAWTASTSTWASTEQVPAKAGAHVRKHHRACRPSSAQERRAENRPFMIGRTTAVTENPDAAALFSTALTARPRLLRYRKVSGEWTHHGALSTQRRPRP